MSGNLNVFLGIANPAAATNLGGQVVGGLPLQGGFYPTPTSYATNLDSSSRTPSTGSTRAPTSLQPTPLPRVSSEQSTLQPFSTTNSRPLVSSVPVGVASPNDSSLVSPEDRQHTVVLSVGAIVGIVAGAVLVVLLIPSMVWLSRYQRRARRIKMLNQRQSFVDNPIMNSIVIPNQSTGFRGTPYRGEEGDVYYSGPVSGLINNSMPEHHRSFRLSDRLRLNTGMVNRLSHSHSNDINYLEVMGNRRIESILSISNNSGTETTLANNTVVGLQKLHTYKNALDCYEEQDSSSGQSEESESIRSRITSFGSIPSERSILFPQVAVFRSGPKNDAGIPIQNLQANRIQSQVAESASVAEKAEDITNTTQQQLTMENKPPSFYIPRTGDPTKISFNRANTPSRSLVSRATNFSYPMPRAPVAVSPPEVPGPILNRPRYQFGPEPTPALYDEQLGQTILYDPEPTRPGSTATPSFSNNRYIPNKTRKKHPNANVLSVLNNSSRRKSTRAQSSARQNTLSRGRRLTTSSLDSLDIPDPYNQGPTPTS